jgi:hypothetical protein
VVAVLDAGARLKWLRDEYGESDIDFRTFQPLVAENQRLRDALELIAKSPNERDALIARAALAGTPREDTGRSDADAHIDAKTFPFTRPAAGTPSEDTECPRCKGSGVVASTDGEAMDCNCGTPSEDTR